MIYPTNTYTKTYTYSRVEAIQDQFDHFLRFGGIDEDTIRTIREGVTEQKVRSVGLYALNFLGLRVLEISLTIDWSSHGRLVLAQPHISRELSVWEGTLSPEVKVAGRRFHEVASSLGARPQCWVAWVREEYGVAKGFTGEVPAWAGQVEERGDLLLDLAEMSVHIRSAPGHA